MAALANTSSCRRILMMGLSSSVYHGKSGTTNIMITNKTSLLIRSAVRFTTQRAFTTQISWVSWKRTIPSQPRNDVNQIETLSCHPFLARPFSSTTTTTTTTLQSPAAASAVPDVQDEVDDIVADSSSSSSPSDDEQPTMTKPTVIRTKDGRQFAAFDMRRHPKLKPYIVKRRLNRMRTYVGAEKNIRVSPWRLNLVCQLAAGLPLTEALTQLEFCDKKTAPLVQKVLKRTSNLADIRHGLQPSQLEVAECFATKGTPLKRMKFMGRGRTGKKERKHAHFRVVLREIDFKLRIYQAPTINQKKKWFLLQQQAESDYAQAKVKRDEIQRLEREAAAAAATTTKEKKKTVG